MVITATEIEAAHKATVMTRLTGETLVFSSATQMLRISTTQGPFKVDKYTNEYILVDTYLIYGYMDVGLPEFFDKYADHLPLQWKTQSETSPLSGIDSDDKQATYSAVVMMEQLW